MAKLKLVDQNLIELCREDEEERLSWLFLEDHPEFDGYWKVNSFDGSFFFDLRDIVGPYRAISPSKLSGFLSEAEKFGYKVAWMDDPTTVLEEYEGLSDPPPFSLNSSFPNTINGMLPFQIQGYNYLKDVKGGMAVHSTGTGKSRLASALIRGRQDKSDVDVCLVIAKSHNLTNFQRSLMKDADIESMVIEGAKKKRQKGYEEAMEKAAVGPITIVTNYEKFRSDTDEMLKLLEGKRVFILWDEMSAKLSNRTSALYRSIIEVLYDVKRPYKGGPIPDRTRPKALQQIATTATPIEVTPEGFFNCMRLMDQTLLGTVGQFHNEYVREFNRFRQWEPEVWHKLDRLGMRVERVVHQVDKTDPDIAAMFPEVVTTEIAVDWHEKDRKIYDILTKDAAKHGFDEENPLAVITVLQMLCDAPTMVANSAEIFESFRDEVEEWRTEGGEKPKYSGSEIAAELVKTLEGKDLNNDTHTKLEALRELLVDKHPGEKSLVFASLNTGLMPVLKDRLERWGVTYVEYEGTPEERQTAQDYFMEDPDVQVFLSSDKGSDSLDLYEAAIVINYDLPWNWSRLQQRNNRVHRIVSNHETVYFYDLVMVNSVEDRKRELIERKKGFHDGVFRGSLADKSMSARMTKSDLMYALRG